MESVKLQLPIQIKLILKLTINFFRNFTYNFCDKSGKLHPYADIFDRAVIDRNNWQMYGSSKNKQAGAYKSILKEW